MPASVLIPSEIANQIRHKKAQYCRFIDTKQFDKLSSLALPNATFTFLDPDGSISKTGNLSLVFHSPVAFAKFLSRIFPSNVQTLHHVSVGELEMVGSDEVNAIWGMEDEILVKRTLGLVAIRGGGYYHETWKLVNGDSIDGNGRWLLESLKLERTYMKRSLTAGLLLFLQKMLGL